MQLINGCESECLPVADRGLHYGDGLFETLAVRSGRPCHWSRHMQRMAEGCRRLGIPFPGEALLETEALRVCRGRERAVLKIVVTRGPGGRGYRPPQPVRPTRVVSVHEYPVYPDAYFTEGVRVRTCTTRWSVNPALAGIKHLNRLEQVLARAEWDDEMVAEGLMLDSEDRLVSGTMSNVFLVCDGALQTPALHASGVAGTTRARVMEQATGLGVACKARPLRGEDLAAAQELFLCNSLIGIWPVRQIDGTAYAVGPVTRRFLEAIRPHGVP